MKSVADESAREVLEATLRLTPSERVELALRLGTEAVAAYSAAHGVTSDEARRILRRNNQRGRRPSVAASLDE
jgi:endonuclease V-like protein UPF0215 family